MTRIGKIARLPHSVREQVNLRLQNGGKGKQIVQWLNSLAEVREVMAADFQGEPVNEMNLSNWKLGGYRDWLAEHDVQALVRLFNEGAEELKEAANGSLTDKLALCTVARMAVAFRQLSRPEADPAEQMKRLRQLCADIAVLRRGDQNAEWMQIERERMDLKMKKMNAAAQWNI
jgi:hypothetical protein